MGFEYITASDKEEFQSLKKQFLDSSSSKAMIFEVFTKPEDEIESSNQIRNIESDIWPSLKRSVKSLGKDLKRKMIK